MNKPRLYRRKGQKVWSFYFYDEKNERIFRKTDIQTKRAAEDYAEKYVADFLHKRAEPQKITLEEYAGNFYVWDKCEWVKRQHAKGRPFSSSQAKNRRGHLKNYIFKKFGRVKLQDLEPVAIENWLIKLKLANGTKNSILYSLNIILNEAKRQRLIKVNPIDDVEPLANTYQERGVFTIHELRQLFPDDMDELLKLWTTLEYATLFNVLAATGIRMGEARGLQWRDVLWDLQAILIVRAVKADGSLGEPKARERRGVFLPSKTLNLLTRWKEQCIWDAPDHLVFYGIAARKPINKHTLLDRFNYAMKHAKIKKGDRILVPHSLRHTFNSMMRRVLPEDILREFTGHRSVKMTDRYDHEALEARIRKLEGSRALIEGVWQEQKKT